MTFTNCYCVTVLDKHVLAELDFSDPFSTERSLADLIGSYCDFGNDCTISECRDSFESARYDHTPFFNMQEWKDDIIFAATVICEEYDEDSSDYGIECYYHPYFRLSDDNIKRIKEFIERK